jgi:hypothetical protein
MLTLAYRRVFSQPLLQLFFPSPSNSAEFTGHVGILSQKYLLSTRQYRQLPAHRLSHSV